MAGKRGGGMRTLMSARATIRTPRRTCIGQPLSRSQQPRRCGLTALFRRQGIRSQRGSRDISRKSVAFRTIKFRYRTAKVSQAGSQPRSWNSRRCPTSLPERLLDVNEAAAMLSLKPSTLYQWAYERRLPIVKLGRALRFRLSDIEELIARSLRPPLAQQSD
jgi:excisionase family DNA binding protein